MAIDPESESGTPLRLDNPGTERKCSQKQMDDNTISSCESCAAPSRREVRCWVRN